ncbi:MAG: DUF4386 family protein [Dehalococcoidia bacterium]|nr:DUF4386 family protein [Dehalococcoidia bacterium]
MSAGDSPDRGDVGKYLQFVNDKQNSLVLANWFFLLGVISTVGALPGFYQVLRKEGVLVAIAIWAMAIGLVLDVAFFAANLGIAYKLAPGYASAVEASKLALGVVASTISIIATLEDAVGDAFFCGIGLALFAYASLKTNFVPKWAGWMGLLGSLVTGWVGAFSSLAHFLELVVLIGFVPFFIWFVIMGIRLVRAKKPATT